MTFESTIVYKGRVKIMRLLAQNGEATINQMTKQTGNNHGVTLKHLKTLEKTGVVTQKLVGKTRLWMYAETPRGHKVKDFFRAMEAQE